MDKNKKIRELIHYYCGGTYENRKLVADKICKIYDDEAINFTDSSSQLNGNKIPDFKDWVYFNFTEENETTFQNKHDGTLIDKCYVKDEYERFKDELLIV